MLTGVVRDILGGVRLLFRSPGFSLATILILGIGVGSATSIFSIVNSVLLRPLPFPDSERIVRLYELNQRGATIEVSYPNYRDLAEQLSSFESIAAASGGTATVGAAGESRRVWAVGYHGAALDVYGYEAAYGRLIEHSEVAAGTPVAVASRYFAESMWGDSASALNQVVTASGVAFTIVGILKPMVDERVDLWLPATALGLDRSGRDSHNWSVVAKLTPAVSLGQAQAEATGIYQRLLDDYGQDAMASGVAIRTLLESTVESSRAALNVFSAAVALLLLIVCANIANLLLARGSARRREVALRTALGASRVRIVRQLILENAPMALLGGLLGTGFAVWSFSSLLALIPRGIPRRAEIAIDPTALAFGVMLALLCGLIFAIAPAIRTTTEGTASLRSGASAVAGGDRNTGQVLVAGQLALALCLLVCSGLLLKSLIRVMEVDPGFDYESTLLAETSLPKNRYVGDAQMTAFWRTAIERIDGLPQVEAVGLALSAPLEGSVPNGRFTYLDGGGLEGSAYYGVATAGYFHALAVPLLRGRLFDGTDTAESPHVAVINRNAADTLWAGEDPLGKRLAWEGMDVHADAPLTIVGVVGNVRNRSLTLEPRPQIYVNYFQRPARARDADLVVRATDPGAVTDAVRIELEGLDPSLAVRFQTVQASYDASLARPRIRVGLIGFFAACAVALSCLGLFSSMAYRVSRRTRELGIRLALGATGGAVQEQVLVEGIRMTAAGALLGALMALGMGRVLASLLYGVSSADPATFLGAAVLLFLIAALAAFIPARRAARTSPAVALRHE